MSKNDKLSVDSRILEIVQKVMQFDSELREKYKVGHKFRFVTDRLNTLIQQLEHATTQSIQIKESNEYSPENDETVVYVHLFNVHGLKLSNWQNMLNPSLLYEYSVNRPIYLDKKSIETLIDKKSNQLQHAYITIAVKNADIVPIESVDTLGNPMIRVREGSLNFSKFISFTHNKLTYRIDNEGFLIKKEDK